MRKRLAINMSKLSIGGMEKALVDFINKSVTGKVQYSRTAPGSDPVTVTLLPDYEEDTYGNS